VGKLGEIGKAQKPLTEVEMKPARTKKELKERAGRSENGA